MQHNPSKKDAVTNPHNPSQSETLSTAQLIAVDALASGKRDAEAAELAGVCRETVTRWRLNSSPFRKELSDRRAEIWGGTANRIRALLPQAVEILANALSTSDNPVPIALALLKLVGPIPVAPTAKDEERSWADEWYAEIQDDANIRKLAEVDGSPFRPCGINLS